MTDDDMTNAELPDDGAANGDASARGILQCLRMLADEAASLRMVRTLTALREALETCRAETDMSTFHKDGLLAGPPPGAQIH